MKYDWITETLVIKSFEFVVAQFFLPATDPQYVGSLASGSVTGDKEQARCESLSPCLNLQIFLGNDKKTQHGCVLVKDLLLSVYSKICPNINNHSRDQHSFQQLFLSNWVNDIFDNVNGKH